MLDRSKLLKETARLASGGGFGQNAVRMPEGKGAVVVRLLSKSNSFYAMTRIHNVNGKNLHCPREMAEDGYWRGPCPICEYYNLLWKNLKTKSEEEQAHDKTIARAIKPIERYYYNCIVRQETDPETGEISTNVGPKLLSIGKTLHEIIITNAVEYLEKKQGDVTDPVAGRDLRIIKNIKKGSDGDFPDYVKSKFEDPSPLGTPEEVEKWLANLHDLTSLRKVVSYNELLHQLRIHFGLEKDNSVGFDVAEFSKANGKTEPEPTVQRTEDPPEPAVVGDEPLADGDFMKGLEDI